MPAGSHFALVFWDNGTGPLAFPITGMAPAGAGGGVMNAARQSLHGFSAVGSSDALPTLDQVVARHADQVILLTAKAADLPEDFAAKFEGQLRSRLGDTSVPFPVISILAVGGGIGDVGGATASLEKLAGRTGGTFRIITPDDLRHTIQQ